MSRSSVSTVGQEVESLKSIAFAGLSCGTLVTSFFVKTLPVVQWFAACVAITSGIVGICWVCVQYLRTRSK